MLGEDTQQRTQLQPPIVQRDSVAAKTAPTTAVHLMSFLQVNDKITPSGQKIVTKSCIAGG